ncbi:MAG: hypothetical protein LAT76_08845 [Schleiferiaceae bacterium]|nr:hypothetical protein [Schleiferiaceae bacterium]
MVGIVIMVVGLLTLIVGIVIYFNATHKVESTEEGHELEKIIEMAIADGVLTTNEKKLIEKTAGEKGLPYNDLIKDIEHRISSSNGDSETELINQNKKNGDDFEKFVAQKFDPKFFTIKEWAGDKYINGIYADTTPQPDMLLVFKLKGETHQLSIECKWRKSLYKNGIVIAKQEQLERYQDFQESRNIPVFLAIGVGGKGMSPEQLFIVPLAEIKSSFMHINKLKSFEKKLHANFFFDYEKKELR